MIRKILTIAFCLCSILHAVYLHEGWDAGSFSANAWSKDSSCGNWQIMNVGGYHLRFAGFPEVENYDSALLSRTFDLDGVSSMSLDFKLKGISLEPIESEYMAVEYSIDDAPWTSMYNIQVSTGDIMDPLDSYSYDFPVPVSGSSFRFRFRAYGENTANILFWRIDDILLKDQNYQVPATITGLVCDNSFQGLADVLVTDGQNFARTGFSGSYTLQVQPSAQLTVSAKAFSYNNASVELTGLSSGASAVADFSMVAEDGQIMDPYALNANMNYSNMGVACGLSWNAVHEFPGDGAIELAYDTPPVEYFYNPFMINECEYLVVKFERDWELNIGAVKMALKSMMPTEVEIVAFYENNGQPDLNNPVFSAPQVFEFIPEVAGYPQWQQFPLPFFVEPETAFYLGVKFRNGDLYSIGNTVTDDSRSYYSFDSENDWEIADGEAAMIRLLANEYEPWDGRNVLGYNLYRDHQKLNDSPLIGTYYYDNDLSWGEHIYYATAVYSSGESNISNSVRVSASPVVINSVFLSHSPDEEQHAIVNMLAYKMNGGVSSLSLLRDGLEVFSYTNPDLEQEMLECYFQDFVLANDSIVEYQLRADYQDGSSSYSSIYPYRYLMAPQNLVAMGCEEGVSLSWEAPIWPDRAFWGYRISRSGNGEYLEYDFLIQETDYLDTGMEMGLVYDYLVTAVYADGVADTPMVSVVAGPAVYHPVTALNASIEANLVKLQWQRPDDSYLILGKDAPGKSIAFAPGHSFIAGVRFAPGQMMQAIDHSSVGLAFIPTTDDPVTVRMYNCSNPEEEFLCDQYTLDNPIPNEWNFVPSYSIHVEMIQASYRFELETAGGLMLDNSTTPIDGANGIMIDGNMSDLDSEYGISQNWKLKLKMKENETIVPVVRDLYPVLTGYKVICNGELVSMESEYDQYYQEPASSNELRNYYIIASYDTGDAEPSNTVTVEPVSNQDQVLGSPLLTLSNHPNPFNPDTRISFSLREAAQVKLQIFNLKGQLVKNMLEGNLTAGNHTIVWNGKDDKEQPVSSGIYFLRLNDGKRTISKKMCLQK